MKIFPKFIRHAFDKMNVYTLIRTSGLFDDEWYKEKYLKDGKTDMSPLKHFLKVGYREGNSPSPKFSCLRYVTAYPEVSAHGQNPLLHYLRYGKKRKYLRYEEKGIESQALPARKERPLVSIIVTSYNYAHLIPETFDSLLKQTYDNYEIIVVDDGSKDNSVDVIKSFVSKSEKIKLFQHPNGENRGIIKSMMLAINNAKGDYIAFCESDDYWAKDHLEKKVDVINRYADVVIVSNNIQLVGDKKCIEQRNEYITAVTNLLRTGGNKIDLLHNQECNFIPTFSSVMIKRSVLQSLDFDSPIPAWIDFWLYRQILKDNLLYFVEDKITYWRQHESYNGVESIEEKAQENNMVFIPASNKLIGIKNPKRKAPRSVRKSKFFDEKYYAAQFNGKLYDFGAAMHYSIIGWKKGASPSATFDNDAYLTQNIDIISTGTCPLMHYEEAGRNEGRKVMTVEEVKKHCLHQSDLENIKRIGKEKKTFLLLTHELTITGAPRALLNLAISIKKQGGVPVVISPKEGNIHMELEKAGIECKIVYSLLPHKYSLPDDGVTLKEYAACFDTVVFNTIATLPFIESIRNTDCKKVCWIHEGWMGFEAYSYNNKRRRYLEKFDEILVVGQYVEKILNDNVPGLENIRHFLYGMNESIINNETVLKSHQKIKIIMAATIDARKGQDLLLEALASLPKEVLCKMEITIAGKKHDQILSDRLMSQDIVDMHVLGEVEHDALLNMINDSDVLFCTSIDDPMPISSTEAMMLGVPVLTSDNTGTAKYIEDGKNGFVFKSGDVSMLASKIRNIVEYNEELCSIGQEARNIYMNHFCPEVFDRNVNEIFLK